MNKYILEIHKQGYDGHEMISEYAVFQNLEEALKRFASLPEEHIKGAGERMQLCLVKDGKFPEVIASREIWAFNEDI